ncbi:MAG TPA: hypothetical protein VIJ22_19010 [Polyangiaceae bacterium]
MNLSHLGGHLPFAALVADPLFATDRDGDSGSRTLVGTCIVLMVLAIVISIGVWMGRRERA